MHLWPTLRIRDSFKQSYLTKLEWNLHRMKQSEASAAKDGSADAPLVSSQEKATASDHPPSPILIGLFAFSRDLVLLLSCCFCCYCCGACHDEEEK